MNDIIANQIYLDNQVNATLIFLICVSTDPVIMLFRIRPGLRSRFLLHLCLSSAKTMNDTTSRAAAAWFTRTLLGVIFLMQGYGKVFTFTIPKLYHMFFLDFEKTFLPKWLIWATAYYTSYTEMICGFLLIVGLFRKCALYLLAADLLIVSFGHGLLEPIWDLQHVIPRAILLIAILVMPGQWDKWNLDRILFAAKNE